VAQKVSHYHIIKNLY